MEWQVAVGVVFSMGLMLVPAGAIVLLNFLDWRARNSQRLPLVAKRQPATVGTMEERYSHP